jgi:hypothetical protein
MAAAHIGLSGADFGLGRFDEARQIEEQSLKQFPDSEFIHWLGYLKPSTSQAA